ncbi:MAG: carboxymuconolactone decarboxylase family protein, partial [Burkholderiaceae bacterium]
MEYITELKALIPDYAKDVRINLDGVLGRSSLPANEAAAVALAAAYAAQAGR